MWSQVAAVTLLPVFVVCGAFQHFIEMCDKHSEESYYIAMFYIVLAIFVSFVFSEESTTMAFPVHMTDADQTCTESCADMHTHCDESLMTQPRGADYSYLSVAVANFKQNFVNLYEWYKPKFDLSAEGAGTYVNSTTNTLYIGRSLGSCDKVSDSSKKYICVCQNKVFDSPDILTAKSYLPPNSMYPLFILFIIPFLWTVTSI